jgi:hypothetical protein
VQRGLASRAAVALLVAAIPLATHVYTSSPAALAAHRPASHPHSTLTTTVNVLATQPWTDTGISLSAGETVTITATGTLYVGYTDPGTAPIGKPTQTSGYTMIAPNITPYCLLARIGAYPPGRVGAVARFTAKVSGELTLGLNDDYFGDNSGSWTATVSVS